MSAINPRIYPTASGQLSMWSFPRCLNMLSCLISGASYSSTLLYDGESIKSWSLTFMHWQIWQQYWTFIYYYWFANILLVRCRISNGTPASTPVQKPLWERFILWADKLWFQKKIICPAGCEFIQIYVQNKYNSKQTSINCTCALLKYKMYNL